jgi:oligoribonuclease
MSEPNAEHLVWMDLEMSGLDAARDEILEIATLVSNADLEVVAEGPTIVIGHPPSLFDRMDDWNREHHSASGLWDRVLRSSTTVAEAEQQVLDFVRQHVGERSSPLCGN